MTAVISRKKLIEVALPLDAINAASAREKSIRHGHPSTLHLWWARRPLAAARAVIFSQMVDDPSEYVDVLLGDAKKRRKAESVLKARRKVWEEAKATAERAARGGVDAQLPAPGPEPTLREVAAELERERLFEIIRQLVLWENTTNEAVLQAARDEIWQSWRRTCADNAGHPRAKELFDRHKLPAFHDPFAGGGALPLEAQRLGLESYASDLNPVAVLINKAMIEIPPKFAGKPPVNPDARKDKELFAREWKGAQGLAEDVRYYGQWMRDQAEQRIGHLYPKVEITAEMAKGRPDLKQYIGKKLTVIAWLWARTVKSPDPAFARVDVPLVTTFLLASKPGKEAYIAPVIEGASYRFAIKVGASKNLETAKHGTKLGRANFRCLLSGAPIPGDYIQAEGRGGRIGARMMAIVAEGVRERVYLPPTGEMEEFAHRATPEWKPDVEFFQQALGFRIGNYGMTKWSDLFSSRQIVALSTFSDLVSETRERVERDALSAGLPNDHKPIDSGGQSAAAYADAVAVYLGLSASKAADNNSTLCAWMPGIKYEVVRNTFSRHALPMSWDYAEANPFAESSGDFYEQVKRMLAVFDVSFVKSNVSGRGTQQDAQSGIGAAARVVSTDPPYYDNIGYGDLSDFFYVWLRRSLITVVPNLFATLAVPKVEELIASPHRHGSKDAADVFFLDGMTVALRRLSEQAHPAFPVTIYYAFKQSETDGADGIASTGWETFLGAVIRAGFALTGTWPVRTEREVRSRGIDSNALASSIVLVCRKHNVDAPTVTRREFVATLKSEVPRALAQLQRGNIAPVDLAQAAIGPGMAVYTRYDRVLDAEGKPTHGARGIDPDQQRAR